MRFGLKAKEVLAVTLFTFLVVAATTLVHFSQLTRLTVQDALSQADLIVNQIYAQTSRVLSRSRGRNPRDVLWRNPELRGLLEASVGYSPNLVYAMLADPDGRTILAAELRREGTRIPEQPALQGLLALDPIRRFIALYRPEQIYEVALPLNLDGRPFGNIRLGVSLALLRREFNASLTRALVLAGVALPLAWLMAMGLANLALKPIRRISQEMERLRRGEFEVGGDLAREDDFKELASQLQLLGQQIQSDRLKAVGEQSHLQQVVDRLEDGLIFFSQDRRILFLNRAAGLAMGRPADDVLGRPLDDTLEPSHPLRSLLGRGLAQTAGFRNATVTLPQDASSKEFLVSAFPLADSQKPMGVMVLLKDLDSIRTLQSLVSYSAKLAALGRLTSGIAHEVKNPLNAMTIHLELLKERLGTPSEGVTENLEVLESEIKRLDRAVQGFLKFMRPQELNLAPVELNTLLRSVQALLQVEWESKGIRFVFQEESNLPPITADEELLRQVFLNILLNACQAMPSGGTVTLMTERESRAIVRVTITDEGVGISPENLDKIFKLYYSTKPEGSGIGLALVYRIVQQHDGSIDVSSEVGRGTTVRVRLPVG